MTDWKDSLAALMGTTAEETTPSPTEDVAKKHRNGVVYSTNPNFSYESDNDDMSDTLPNNQQQLRVSMERAGRGGKTVTLIRGFVGTDADLQSLAKVLKQRCGVGGSAKDAEVIIQGDHRQRIVELLKQLGYTQTKG